MKEIRLIATPLWKRSGWFNCFTADNFIGSIINGDLKLMIFIHLAKFSSKLIERFLITISICIYFIIERHSAAQFERICTSEKRFFTPKWIEIEIRNWFLTRRPHRAVVSIKMLKLARKITNFPSGVMILIYNFGPINLGIRKVGPEVSTWLIGNP